MKSVTGFRIAPGGAQEFYGVRADIATYGKVIGGGLPFAAIAGECSLDGCDGRRLLAVRRRCPIRK